MFMKELAEDIDLAKTGVEWGECQVKGAASTKALRLEACLTCLRNNRVTSLTRLK